MSVMRNTFCCLYDNEHVDEGVFRNTHCANCCDKLIYLSHLWGIVNVCDHEEFEALHCSKDHKM